MREAASAAFAKSWRGDELAQQRNENKIAERNYAPNDNQEIKDFHRHSGRGESELCREFARLIAKPGGEAPDPRPHSAIALASPQERRGVFLSPFALGRASALR